MPHAVYDALACCSIPYATLPDGLVYGGSDPEDVCELMERQRVWYDRAAARHILSDAELVRSLPYRLQRHLWAVFVAQDSGLTEEQSLYDPWATIWKP